MSVLRSIILAIACAGTVAGSPTRDQAANSRAARTAMLLARVDEAVGMGGRAGRIMPDVRALDRLGVHPADGEDDPQLAWRKVAGATGDGVFRGRVLGPAFRRGWIEAGATTRTEQQFLAGQRSTLAVAASPATPLDLRVTDADRNGVCQAAATCSWMPEFTQRYTITIHNPGPRRVRFYLVVD